MPKKKNKSSKNSCHSYLVNVLQHGCNYFRSCHVIYKSNLKLYTSHGQFNCFLLVNQNKPISYEYSLCFLVFFFLFLSLSYETHNCELFLSFVIVYHLFCDIDLWLLKEMLTKINGFFPSCFCVNDCLNLVLLIMATS